MPPVVGVAVAEDDFPVSWMGWASEWTRSWSHKSEFWGRVGLWEQGSGLKGVKRIWVVGAVVYGLEGKVLGCAVGGVASWREKEVLGCVVGGSAFWREKEVLEIGRAHV